MSLLISVIICTHNPREAYLERVLESLRNQTLEQNCWELLLLDNRSDDPLAARWNLGWHRNGRHIREEELGLTSARLRGVRESSGELLVFVDDDNVLAENYLVAAAALAETWPHIGAFGGSIRAEFEEPPPQWITRYLEWLAVREIDRDYWSNMTYWSLAVPYGAGMCLRRSVAEDYAAKVTRDPLRLSLGRSGTALASGEDSDMAWCAVDLGMGTGRFRALKMTHVIPKSRLTFEYVTRLSAGLAASDVMLESFRSAKTPVNVPLWREALKLALAIARTPWKERGIAIARQKAERRARRLVARRAEEHRRLREEPGVV